MINAWLNLKILVGDSGAEYVRKEIPLLVLPSSSIFNLDAPLNSFTDLQRVLFEEERTAYNQAVVTNMRWSNLMCAYCSFCIFVLFKC